MTRLLGAWGAAAVLLIAALQAGCGMSSYQTARNLPRGATSLTAAVNSNSYWLTVDGDTHSTARNSFDAMASHGISETFEMGGRVSYYPVEDQDSVLLMAQPKLGIMPRKLAVILPAGIVLADDGHGWELTPGVLYTHFFTPNVSLETAGKLLIAINDDFDDSNTLVGANVGMRFVPNGGRWGLQPEFGFYIDPNEDGAFTQLGIAFVYELGPRDPDRMAGATAGPPPG